MISSGTYNFWDVQYLEKRVQDCLEISNLSNAELVNYLKTANVSTLTKCNGTDWIATVESPNAIRPFQVKKIREYFVSDDPPVVEVLFVVASKVMKCEYFIQFNSKNSLKKCFSSQESIQVYPQLLDEITIPWLDLQPFTLPFKGFTAIAHPKVLTFFRRQRIAPYLYSQPSFSIHSGIQTSNWYIEKSLFFKCILS